MPQRITVMRERTMKSFGVYSYFGGWLAIRLGYKINTMEPYFDIGHFYVHAWYIPVDLV